MARTTKAQEAEREEACVRLRELLKPGDTVYTVLHHVSRSGMSRAINAYKIDDGTPMWLSHLAATATGHRFSERYEAVDMGGAGMDMGFALVYALSQSLYPDGFECIGEECPSNDHFNREVRDWHPEGGYALKHRWM